MRAATTSKRPNICGTPTRGALADRSRRGKTYDPADHTRFVDEVIAAFTPRFYERTRGFGLETDQPIFIVGLPRSGTTLVEQILASHSQVCGAGELRLARDDFEALPAVTGRGETLAHVFLT